MNLASTEESAAGFSVANPTGQMQGRDPWRRRLHAVGPTIAFLEAEEVAHDRRCHRRLPGIVEDAAVRGELCQDVEHGVVALEHRVVQRGVALRVLGVDAHAYFAFQSRAAENSDSAEETLLIFCMRLVDLCRFAFDAAPWSFGRVGLLLLTAFLCCCRVRIEGGSRRAKLLATWPRWSCPTWRRRCTALACVAYARMYAVNAAQAAEWRKGSAITRASNCFCSASSIK
mmetsp:Transcript_15062/g.34573  ORF Transcript_15062/g.34573 Transcript_15062/m.34573 type:complete len:229 (-) Transcript_15062:581-1267(-)